MDHEAGESEAARIGCSLCAEDKSLFKFVFLLHPAPYKKGSKPGVKVDTITDLC